MRAVRPPSLQERQVRALELLVSKCDELIEKLEDVRIQIGMLIGGHR